MSEHDVITAYTKVLKNKSARFPDINDQRYRQAKLKKSGYFIPSINSKFMFSKSDEIFTIGSCFAREIEKILIENQFNPTVKKGIDENPDISGYFFEYTPATIFQRISAAYGHFSYQDDVGIEKRGNRYIDLFARAGWVGSDTDTIDEIILRRHKVSHLYSKIKFSDVVIITLGFVESWYDKVYNCYLNAAPSFYEVKRNPDRYEFRRLSYNDSVSFVEKAINLILSNSDKKIIITVSPIPIDTTFTSDDVIIANSYSKSVLRCAAEEIRLRYPQVEYFPSYEIALSFGLSGTIEDNAHITPFVTEKIMEAMGKAYINN